jgi:hypothetical protein
VQKINMRGGGEIDAELWRDGLQKRRERQRFGAASRATALRSSGSSSRCGSGLTGCRLMRRRKKANDQLLETCASASHRTHASAGERVGQRVRRQRTSSHFIA